MKKFGNIIFLFLLCYSCNSNRESNNTLTQTVLWSQADSSYTNFRIPSLIVSSKNTLLAFAEGREGGDTGDIDVLVKRSFDNGKTWEKQLVVWDDGNNTCGNPAAVVDQYSGRIILLMTWNLGSDHERDIIRKTSQNIRVPYMTYSDDEGMTWSVPEDLSQSSRNPDWGWYATGPGVGIQLKTEKYKGRLIIPCNNSYDAPGVKQRDGFGYGAHVLISDDGGKNWWMSETITPEVNESQIVELGNGTLMMNMRSYNGQHCRAVSHSTDGGETWSGIQHDEQLVEPICQASFIDYGRYGEEHLHLFANPATPYSRTHMTVKSSIDNCKSWTNSKLIYAGPSAYSSLTKLPNGNIGLFFEGGNIHPYEKMVFISFMPKILFESGSLIKSL